MASDEKKGKPETIHLEAIHVKPQLENPLETSDIDKYELVKSRYDELSIPRTLWVFRRIILVSLAVYTGYVCEGFEVGLP